MWNPWLASLVSSLGFFAVLIIGAVYLIKKHTLVYNSTKRFWSKINTKLRKSIFLCGIILIGFVLLVPVYRTATYVLNYRYVDNGYAEWRESNGQPYLYVEAENYYDLGYLQGVYLWKQIFNFRAILLGQYIGNYDVMKIYSEQFLPYISEDYQKEMLGMAVGASKASGWPFTFLDIVFQNTYLDMYFGHHSLRNSGEPPMGCTSFGAVNQNGSTMFGQNFDFPKIMGRDDFNTLSFVHTKMPNVAEIFGLRVGAMLNIPCAKTSNGVYTLVNIIESNMTGAIMTPSTLRTRYALERATCAADLFDLTFNGRNQSHSANLMIADENNLIGVQILPTEYRTRNNTAIVNSNTFIYQDWRDSYFPLGDYSLTRQLHAEYLLNSALENDGQLSHEELIGILGNNTQGMGAGSEIWRVSTTARASMTLAFFTKNGFGLGNVHDGIGLIPF